MLKSFKKWESKIYSFEKTDSTMTLARDMAKNNAPDFTVITADRQTGGRGRLKRTWISEKGGLYFTVILRPDLPVSQAHIVNFAASLSLAETLQNHFQINAQVKWPNDVHVNGKKISGILSEMETEEDRIVYINIGIGINVNNDPTEEEPNATSVKKILGKDVPRKKVLSLFLDEFKRYLDVPEVNIIMNQWKKHTLTLGKAVRVTTRNETTEGIALDIDVSGALIVKQKDGTVKKVIYGDCFIQ